MNNENLSSIEKRTTYSKSSIEKRTGVVTKSVTQIRKEIRK